MIVTIGTLQGRIESMNHQLLRSLLAVIITLQAARETACSQEWAQFRGPGASGLSEAKGIPAKISDKNIRWSRDLPGTGHSSPVLWGTTIFLTATDGEAGGVRYILALDAKNGEEKWRNKQPFGVYRQHRFNDYSSSTPCCDASGVYVTWTSPKGVEVVAMDHAGKQRWSKVLGKFYAKHGSSASPVLAGGALIIGSHGENGASFIAGLDPESGKEKWRIKRESNDKGAYSTPVTRRAHDGILELVFSSTAHGITALNPANGKIRWEHDAGFSQRCVGGPVISGNTIFVAAGSGQGGKESAVVNVSDGKPMVAWEAGLKGLPYVPTGLSFKGLMFLLNDGGIMTCRRAKDGEILWQERVVGAPYSSPICINDKIYCCSKEGDLNVLLASDKLEPVSSYRFPEGIYATPAVAGGNLFIRTFSKLYCIGE
jgi:outer membrane protein assembly factor BamB